MDIKNNLRQQYNTVSKVFSNSQINYNKKSNERYFDFFKNLNINHKKILDLGCGDGTEMIHFLKKGGDVVGIDESDDLVNIAKAKNIDALVGDFENLPFDDCSFDMVVSKYAIQTLGNLGNMYSESHRVLKKNGILYFMVVHPFRQFLEKKELSANYFERTIVQSKIFGGTLAFAEPTHTMNDYIGSCVLEKFDVIFHDEGEDFVSAERIREQTYPTYLIIALRKK